MQRSDHTAIGGQRDSPRVRDVVTGDGPAIKPLLDQLGYTLYATSHQFRKKITD